MKTTRQDLQALLDARFADAPQITDDVPVSDTIRGMAAHGSCRAFLRDPIPNPVMQMLCATAFASPTKSDLQQRDIIVIQSAEIRQQISDLVAGQAWVAQAPTILIFCGNNRRQRLLHRWKDIPFANDHLDAFFNAIGDAAIALGAFVTAAESVGLGCCPISAVRNEAAAISDMLELPAHVFPFAGLAVGYPEQPLEVSKRLPFACTYHEDRYREDGLQAAVEGHDGERAAVMPYASQRFVGTFGESETYGWSDDKVRQYSQPERDQFGAFVRAKGFKLD